MAQPSVVATQQSLAPSPKKLSISSMFRRCRKKNQERPSPSSWTRPFQRWKSSKVVTGDTLSKIEALQQVPLFVLDNSVRESTVANIRGHTVADKYALLNIAVDAGLTHLVAGHFGERLRVDDTFCMDLRDHHAAKYEHCHLYCFSEFRDAVVDGTPTPQTPIGIRRAAKYNIANVIVEVDLLCSLTTWNIFTQDMLIALLQSRIDAIRDTCRNPYEASNHIFVNIRDFCVAWAQEPERLVGLVKYLAKSKQHIFGLVFEDPTGACMSWIVADYVRATRSIMDRCGWKDGHLLVHIHRAYGIAEASVLESIAAGATGIWCGVACDGAAAGHANSLTTVANLNRLGNEYVQDHFNLPRLRKAAIEMTQIITGDLPHPMTELYGSRALDICFDGNMMGVGEAQDDMLAAFGVPRRTRISTMCSAEMLGHALVETFGGDFKLDQRVSVRMIDTIEADLGAGRREEYNSVIGIVSLYERSGGQMAPAILQAVSADKELEKHPLIQQLYKYWCSCRTNEHDDTLTYELFYEGFMASYLKCYPCQITKDAFALLDLDADGFISWVELSYRAKWALKEYPDECVDVASVIRILFEHFLVPEIAVGLRQKYSADRRLSVTRHRQKNERHLRVSTSSLPKLPRTSIFRVSTSSLPKSPRTSIFNSLRRSKLG